MGIKDLNKIIKKEAPNSIGTVSLEYFKGKKIAIDGHNLIYKNMAVARKIVSKKTNFAVEDIDESMTRNEWLRLCLNFAIKFMKQFITPIFIFDGPNAPFKESTKMKRREIRKEAEDKFNEKRKQLSEMDILDRTPDLIQEIQDSYSKYVNLRMDDIQYLYSCLDNLGIPWMQSTGEAEKLCTMLCREGKVAAVFSRDTDNLAMGCPLLLTDMDDMVYKDGKSTPSVIYYEYDVILDDMKMDKETFLDLCILLECDYNKRIKGIGPVNALKMMREYGSIPEISKIKDVSCLNYEACLVNFAPVESDGLLMKGNMSLRDNPIDEMRDVLDNIGMSKIAHQLCTAISVCLNFEAEVEIGLASKKNGYEKDEMNEINEMNGMDEKDGIKEMDGIKEKEDVSNCEDIRNKLSLFSFTDSNEKDLVPVKKKKIIKIKSDKLV